MNLHILKFIPLTQASLSKYIPLNSLILIVPMASFHSFAILTLAFALFVQATLGSIECENLNKDSCAFAVSSSGKRCVLEKHVKRSGFEVYDCHTSEIEADKLKDWIETDECLKACSLERNVFGISSDSLLETSFTHSLCSPKCYNNCPNIVDLYFNLAAGEGVYLPKLCESLGENARRGMAELNSSGFVAPGPVSKLSTTSEYNIAPSPYVGGKMHSEYESADAPSPYYGF